MKHIPKTVILLELFCMSKIFCKTDIQDIGRLCKNGFKVSGIPLLTVENIGFIGCAKYCVSYGGCEGFSYHRTYHTCTLSDNTTATENSEGWAHCSDLQWVKDNKMGACANETPPPGKQCFELKSGRTVFVVVSCPSTPSIANGIVSIEERTIGSNASFTCNSNYIADGVPYTFCKSNGNWSDASFSCTVYGWPAGIFTLLQPESGCPPSFDSGHIKFPLESGSSSSSPNHAKGEVTTSYVTWYFCTNKNVGTESWPAGDYCIMKSSSCPTGFSTIHFHIHATAALTKEGKLVYYTVTSQYEARVYFCCRSDGNVNTAITLPTTNNFILFQNVAFTCQKVNGMSSIREYTHFDDKVTGSQRTYYHNDNTGIAQYDRSILTIRLFYCYYYK